MIYCSCYVQIKIKNLPYINLNYRPILVSIGLKCWPNSCRIETSSCDFWTAHGTFHTLMSFDHGGQKLIVVIWEKSIMTNLPIGECRRCRTLPIVPIFVQGTIRLSQEQGYERVGYSLLGVGYDKTLGLGWHPWHMTL